MINRIFNKFFYHISVTFITQIIVTLINIYILNLLSLKLCEEEFGIYLLIKRVASFGFPLLTLNLGISLARYNSLKPRNSDLLYLLTLLISTIFFVFFSFIVLSNKSFFSDILFQKIDYGKYLIPCLIYLFATSLLNINTGYFRGRKKYYLMNCCLFLFWFLSLLFYFFRQSNDFLFTYMMYSSLAIIIILLILSLSSIRHIEKIVKTDISEFTLFGLKRIPSVFFYSSIFSLPVLVASNEYSLKQAAYIGIIISITRLIEMIGQPFNTLFVPSFASLKLNKSETDIKYYSKLIFEILIGFPLISGAFLVLFSNEIIFIWFGDKYLPVTRFLSIVAPSIGFLLMYVVIRGILDGLYARPYNNLITVISGAIIIIFSLLVILFSLDIFVLIFGLFLSLLSLGLMSMVIFVIKTMIFISDFRYAVPIIWFLTITFLFYYISKITPDISVTTSIIKIAIAVIILMISWIIYSKMKIIPVWNRSVG